MDLVFLYPNQVKEIDSMLNSSVEERNEHIKSLEAQNKSLQQELINAEEEKTTLKETCSELENEFESARKEHELKLKGVMSGFVMATTFFTSCLIFAI